MKKTLIIYLTVTLLVSISINLHAQDWELNGNPVSNTDYLGSDNSGTDAVRFMHLADDPDSRFEWHTNTGGTTIVEQMRLTRVGRLGIGTNNPQARTHVFYSPASPGGAETGFQVTLTPSTFGLVGGFIEVENASAIGLGLYSTCGLLTDTGTQTGVLGDAFVDDEGEAVGVEGNAETEGEDAIIIGVRGIATAPIADEICGNMVVGVWGETNDGIEISSVCNNVVWAGHFVGDVDVTGDVFEGSDEMLKQNIEPLTGALTLLNQLSPKSYEFRTSEFPMLNLPEGPSRGLIAQEVETIIPEIVRTSKYPRIFDDQGNIISEEFEYKTLSYTELIPLLLGGMQEQQAIIETQNEILTEQINRLNDLESIIQSCCNLEKNLQSKPSNDIRIEDKSKATGLNQNAPNPFDAYTRISFSLASDCRVRVCIYNASGQQIDCLIDEARSAGEHMVEWNTSDIAKGVYFYSLETDGFEQVRRAVKL